MCGGSPQPTDPRKEAEAQNYLAKQEAARALAAETRQQEREAALKLEKENAFTNSMNTSYANANNRVTQGFAGRGLDATNYQGDITNYLDRIKAGIPNLDENVGTYYSDNLTDLITGEITGRKRGALGREFDAFAPVGFADDRVARTADDSILASILGEQYDPAAQEMMNAFTRGNLNEVGYDNAMSRLGTQKTAADAQLTDIGNLILGEDRTSLTNYANTGRERANRFELGQTFDTGRYSTGLDDLGTELGGTREGRIRGRLGETPLFSTSGLIAKAGQTQGAAGQTLGLAEALAKRKDSATSERGLGSTGAF